MVKDKRGQTHLRERLCVAVEEHFLHAGEAVRQHDRGGRIGLPLGDIVPGPTYALFFQKSIVPNESQQQPKRLASQVGEPVTRPDRRVERGQRA